MHLVPDLQHLRFAGGRRILFLPLVLACALSLAAQSSDQPSPAPDAGAVPAAADARTGLETEKQSLEQKLGLIKTEQDTWNTVGTIGWITAGAGAAVVVTGFLLGVSARSRYDNATNAADAAAARADARTCNTVYQCGLFGGSAGLLTGLVSLIFRPDSSATETRIKEVQLSLDRTGGRR
jgi:hypothetical protein